jgi:hypothetical protein
MRILRMSWNFGNIHMYLHPTSFRNEILTYIRVYNIISAKFHKHQFTKLGRAMCMHGI